MKIRRGIRVKQLKHNIIIVYCQKLTVRLELNPVPVYPAALSIIPVLKEDSGSNLDAIRNINE